MKSNILLIGGDEKGYHDFRELAPVFTKFLTAAGFSLTVSTDINQLLPRNIKNFAAVVCYLNRQKISRRQEQGLLQAVIGSPWGKTGKPKGFVGVHIAACSFSSSEAYHKMLGARLLTHPELGEELAFKVGSVSHPVMRGIKDFRLADELYLLELYPPMEILLTCEYLGFTRPVAWVKPYGLGRVFYTSLGHGKIQLNNPLLQKMIINAVSWAGGEV